jgi:hypothetical protein
MERPAAGCGSDFRGQLHADGLVVDVGVEALVLLRRLARGFLDLAPALVRKEARGGGETWDSPLRGGGHPSPTTGRSWSWGGCDLPGLGVSLAFSRSERNGVLYFVEMVISSDDLSTVVARYRLAIWAKHLVALRIERYAGVSEDT